MTTGKALCPLLERAHRDLSTAEPGSRDWWEALVSTAQLLETHAGWHFRQQPASHVRIMLATERTFHGVTA